MTGIALPVLFALILWWASTGVIMFLDGLPKRTFKWSMIAATALVVVCLYRIAATADETTAISAYAAFAYGLIAFGWHAMTFYFGLITGPRRTPCPEGLTGWARFRAASGTSIHHELAIAAGMIVVLWLAGDGANSTATWTYLVLWWMHLSGKLNVYLGVPNLAEEFIPEHLAYLRSYMRRRPMNLLFPVSVTVSTVITVMLVERALAAPVGSFEAVQAWLIATLMVLAVLEHWFLVLPLPAMALWSWSLTSRDVPRDEEDAAATPAKPPMLTQSLPHGLSAIAEPAKRPV